MAETFYKKRNFTILREILTTEKTCKIIGSEHSISSSRASQIALKIIRILRHPNRLKGDILPEDFLYSYFSIIDIRKHKEFWLKQLDKFEETFIFTE